MTKERREDLVLITVVLSVALHIGLMFYARSRIMTRVVRDGISSDRREAMRVSDYKAVTPESFERIRDIMSVKDAPEAEVDDVVMPAEEAIPDDIARHFDGEVPAPEAPDSSQAAVVSEEPAYFEVDPDAFARESDNRLPEFEISIPEGEVIAVSPEIGHDAVDSIARFGDDVGFRLEMPVLDASEGLFARIGGGVAAAEISDFKPADEVYEEVDERIVEEEKAAVREILNTDDANDLVSAVDLAAVKHESGEWMYFSFAISPKSSLPVVPKDVVVLLDASGSIGSERLTSCRKAAKSILRSALNTGDRFNVVAFRNRFSYAFRSWQECDADSFEDADGWLNKLTAHGRTEVFETISSVLTLPRDPARPLIALVVTDGDANEGVSDTTEILSKFTALNDGLISVYMYGVRGSANRELIDILTRGNRGESFIYGGSKWSAGSKIEKLSDRFRDPVVSDLRAVFTVDSRAEVYPRLLRNLYRGETIEIVGRVPKGVDAVSFSLRGLNGGRAYEGFFRIPLAVASADAGLEERWNREAAIDHKLRQLP